MINSGPGRSGLSGKSILPSEELRPAALRPLCRGTSSVAVSHTGKINPLGGTDPRALSDLGTRPEGGTVCGHCPDTLPRHPAPDSMHAGLQNGSADQSQVHGISHQRYSRILFQLFEKHKKSTPSSWLHRKRQIRPKAQGSPAPGQRRPQF